MGRLQPFIIALVAIAAPVLLLGGSKFKVPPPGLPAGGGVLDGAASNCGRDGVAYDNNGAQGCSRDSDTAPQDILVKPQACFPGGTQTAADVNICPGMDELTVVIDDFSNCGTDTVTVTVTDQGGAATATVLTEATDWTAETDNATTCTNLATAIEAVAGVSASCSTATVRITPDLGTCQIRLAEGDATCTTVSTGTTGFVRSIGEFRVHSADTATAADYVSVSHNETDGQVTAAAGDLILAPAGGEILTDASNGPAIVAVTGSSLTPNFLPNSFDSNSGYAGGADHLCLEAGGVNSGLCVDEDSNVARVEIGQVINLPLIEADAPSENEACANGTVGSMVYVDDTNDAATAEVCVCLDTDDGSTFDWVNITDGSPCVAGAM